MQSIEHPARACDDTPRLADAFRLALRGFGSTVTVVSTSEGGARHAMVATATMSVSLEPPVLMIAVNQSASCHDPLARRGAFCVNVLGAGNAALGGKIARAASLDRFGVGDWRYCDDDALKDIPFLEESQSAIFCTVRERWQRGTHSLIAGDVRHVVTSSDADPLLYCNGAYGHFSPL
ncbi:MAG TPA: flavin reductase family protein [Paraburkholderia sp.]|nr:flavin reductase family protein [Paraburkholderia sp.]